MKRRKLKIMAVCVMSAAGLMLASCGVADAINVAVNDIVQEATSIAFDEMGGGVEVTLATVDVGNNEDLHVSLVNNAISIQTHAEDMIRVVFSPPTTGEYVTPTTNHNPNSNRFEIVDPSNNISIGGNNRQGVVYVYLPENAAAYNNMDLSTTNGAIRIIGNDGRMAASIEIRVVNGMVELRDFNADDISARSTNGTINASGLITDALAFNTTNGVIGLRDSEISGSLTARTVNGGITLENVDADMGRADVGTVNGVVTIR